MKKALLFPFLIWFIAGSGSSFSADFNGDGDDDLAAFRPATGRWTVRALTRIYFGKAGDIPVPLDYNGDGTDDYAYFRPANGFWNVRGFTRIYFGSAGDVPIGKGGYNPYTSQYDYVVRPGDGDDLERALESATYHSVFVPAGTYNPSESITVTSVKRISGESAEGVLIHLPANSYLAFSSSGCLVERLTVLNGGFGNVGNFYIGGANVTVRDCRSRYSTYEGFLYGPSASGIVLDNCRADYPGDTGFKGSSSVKDSRLLNCTVVSTGASDGFEYCNNLVNCYVNAGNYGFAYCNNIVSSTAYACNTMGFSHCQRLSSCHVDGNSTTLYGMQYCDNLAATTVEDCDVDTYQLCNHFSTQTWGSCD